MFSCLAQILNQHEIKCNYSTHEYPDNIIFESHPYVPSTSRKNVKTTRGFVTFYSYLDNHLAVKFIKLEFADFAVSELKGNLLLIDPPTNCILPVIYALQSKHYFLLISKAMSTDLYELLKTEKIQQIKPSFDNIMKLIKCMVKALLYLNDLNLVHNDIKPENIVKDEKSGNYMLIDFDSLELANANGLVFTNLGTIGLRSLERLKNPISSNSDDIWSLSVVVYEYITQSSGLWNTMEDFTSNTQNIALKRIKTALKKCSNLQVNEIVELFLKMNEYDYSKRIKILDLHTQVCK